ncbi:hypothetical protein Kpol_463p16 [Vanderwaltozyma polyspora DSM 70294]|uniref:C3H1-type domain-containing protein n=1 Tax=Vanderwaltozyma polyspora (strain ATCC 22028 / DSM 70294 / BCRC 21397 / CBS 2163 / NBRC 10782 / NRRL Y-8283 / UCD 57-17) TaxID=436907 RepID=A7TQK2_VANPO|nr:uncharacterized protein Kpol_463p16 [Vanderwaltozyma polyspora DSM 70294]EDO15466.1 hypothetical protein Kpol_463p16 [Vanderwaltozyma polyspora DSM 70294]
MAPIKRKRGSTAESAKPNLPLDTLLFLVGDLENNIDAYLNEYPDSEASGDESVNIDAIVHDLPLKEHDNNEEYNNATGSEEPLPKKQRVISAEKDSILDVAPHSTVSQDEELIVIPRDRNNNISSEEVLPQPVMSSGVQEQTDESPVQKNIITVTAEQVVNKEFKDNSEITTAAVQNKSDDQSNATIDMVSEPKVDETIDMKPEPIADETTASQPIIESVPILTSRVAMEPTKPNEEIPKDVSVKEIIQQPSTNELPKNLGENEPVDNTTNEVSISQQKPTRTILSFSTQNYLDDDTPIVSTYIQRELPTNNENFSSNTVEKDTSSIEIISKKPVISDVVIPKGPASQTGINKTNITQVNTLDEKDHAALGGEITMKLHKIFIKWRSIWSYIKEKSYCDLCPIGSGSTFMGLFFIEFPGEKIIPVSLTHSDYLLTLDYEEEFLELVSSYHYHPLDFKIYIKWIKAYKGLAATDQGDTILFNSGTYNFNHKTRVYELVRVRHDLISNYIAVCPNFVKYGQCFNNHCKLDHDDQVIALCRRNYSTRTCGDTQCLMNHNLKFNPYIVPDCMKYLTGTCKHKYGYENYHRNGDSCIYIHSKEVNPYREYPYPVCRQFAILGFCARGIHCLFKHLKDCPDFKVGAPCLIPRCNYIHKGSPSDPTMSGALLSDAAFKIPKLSLISYSIEKDDDTYYGERYRSMNQFQEEQSLYSRISFDPAVQYGSNSNNPKTRKLTIEERIGIPSKRDNYRSATKSRNNLDPMNRDFISL